MIKILDAKSLLSEAQCLDNSRVCKHFLDPEYPRALWKRTSRSDTAPAQVEISRTLSRLHLQLLCARAG